jgi:hypothetical protein
MVSEGVDVTRMTRDEHLQGVETVHNELLHALTGILEFMLISTTPQLTFAHLPGGKLGGGVSMYRSGVGRVGRGERNGIYL